MSRGDAEDLPGRADWAVISISDAAHGPAQLKPGWRNVLRLEFYDRDKPTLGLTTFNDTHAKAILDFLELVAPHVDGIAVHCFAGISRSAAVAKFIAEMFRIEVPGNFAQPNQLVFETLQAHKNFRQQRPGIQTQAPSAGWN